MTAFEGLPEQRAFSDVTAGREEMLEGKEDVFGGEPELTNYAIVGENIEQEAELAVELLQDLEKREVMLRAQREHFHADAAQRICDLLTEHVKP